MGDAVITDPLGRRITLHDRTWYGHILKGHPEVREHRALVETAVASPYEIRHSSSGPSCRLYIAAGPRPAVRMVVVADVAGGYVKTAYLSKRIKGMMEWP